MIAKIAAIGSIALLLAACAPMPRQAPPPPSSSTSPSPSPEPEAAAAPVAAAPAAVPAAVPAAEAQDSGQPLAPVDVRAMTCATLMGATDDDKAYASTFLLGYRSALMRTHTLDVKRIEAVEQTALADCASKPDAFANKVFASALMATEAGAESQPARRARYRIPARATIEPTSPDQAAPTQSPPLRWTPAQTSSPQTPSPQTPPPPAPAAGPPPQ